MRTKYTPGPWIDPLLHLDAFFSDGKSTTFDPREAYAEEKERAYIAQRGGNAPPKAVEAVRIGARKEFDEGSLVPLSKIIEDREAEIAAAGARHEEVMKQLGRELSALDSKINPVRNKGAKRDALNDRARESRLAYESEVRGILDRYRPAIESHPEEVARKAESRRKTQEMKAQMVAVSAPSTHQDPGQPAEAATPAVIAKATGEPL